MTHIAGYIQALIFALLFLVFINGRTGRALTFVIVGAVLLSLVLVLISAKHFSVKLIGLTGVSEVDKSIELEIILNKTGFCFIPYIELSVKAEDQSFKIRTALLFKKSVSVKVSFTPSHSGLNTIVLQHATIGDFLGNIHKTLQFNEETHIAVLPRIIEYDGPQITPYIIPFDDENIEEGVSVQYGELPGYEYRDYAPGDSVRRVNYKLSAKVGRLIVRLDESTNGASTNLFISDNALPVCCDKAFALARELVDAGATVKISHNGAAKTATSPETLTLLREWLAFRQYAENADQPSLSVPPPDTTVIFSGNGEITHNLQPPQGGLRPP